MSSENSKKKPPQQRNRGGRGGGRGGRGRGRGGGGGRGGATTTNFAGRGPKHFGNSHTRPDSVIPRPVALTSDSEDEEDVDDDGGIGGVEMSSQYANQHIDHEIPVNATPPSSSQPSPLKSTTDTKHPRTRHSYCLICYTHNISHYRSILPCGHDDICAPCMLRLRYLDNDTQCPVCKTSNDTVIVDKDNFTMNETDASDGLSVHHHKFTQYELWGDEILSGGHPDNTGKYVYREDVGMHFPKDVYDKVVIPLCGYACGMDGCTFVNQGDSYVNESDVVVNANNKRGANNNDRNTREVKRRLTGIKALKTHLRMEHGMTLCDLCVDNKRNFVYNLPRFTPAGLKKHENDKQEGHPLCEFCRPKRFYDIVKLHEHLNKEHYKCHICDKQGKPNQFFKDYAQLEKHFDRDHFLCHDAQCLAARFVVFENEIDLRAHEQSVHGTSRRDGGTKIKLEFRVRREGEHIEQVLPSGEDFQFGLNGEAFVPDALPGEEYERQQRQQEQQRQVNEPEITNAAHAARTAELRAMAANIRERDGITASSGGGGGNTEAFPALGVDAAAVAAAGATSSGMLVGWTSDGARTAAGGSRLKKTAVGKVTEEEFPSLGVPTRTGASSRRDRMAAVGLGPKKVNQPAMRGGNFSSVASRPGASPIFTASYSSSIPTTRAPNMNRDNFPSLGGGPKPFVPTAGASSSSRAAPDLSGSNFPSLGGGMSSSSASSANPYAAANAHARKLRGTTAPTVPSAYPSLSSSSDFPAPPAASTKKKSSVSSAFAPKKPPPMDNVLQFPPPSSTKGSSDIKKGMDTVESLKLTLGSANYKRLKSLTKDFANGVSEPERYVDEAASLFDRGVADNAFWEHVPSLIESCPNKSGVNRAMTHLESLRMANQMQTMEFGGGGGSAPKKPINYVLPAKKKTNSWASNPKGQNVKVNSTPSAVPVAAAPKGPTPNAAAKAGGGNSKKSKNKKKNNELKALAFGT